MEIVRDRLYYKHLVVQGMSAVVFMFLVLFSLDHVRASNVIWAAGASTLASSSFSLFCRPTSPIVRHIRIIGGYVVAMLSGHAMRLLAGVFCHVVQNCHLLHVHTLVFEISATLSVGIALFLMALLRLSHPPAAGLAVVMVLDIGNPYAMLVILSGAVTLCIIHAVFNKQLRNLI